MKLLDHISRHPEELRQKKEAAAALHLKSVDEMNREYRCLYEELISSGAGERDIPSRSEDLVNRPGMPDPDFLFQGLAMGNPSVTGRGSAASLNRVREENDMLRTSMEMLKNTTSYRIARKIADANIPFKEPLKKILRKN